MFFVLVLIMLLLNLILFLRALRIIVLLRSCMVLPCSVGLEHLICYFWTEFSIKARLIVMFGGPLLQLPFSCFVY
jgi:hypothetical protein